MRTAHELLDWLNDHAVRVTVATEGTEGTASDWRANRLVVSGKAAAITDAAKADLRRLKTSLLAVLLVCDCPDCIRRRALRIGKDYAANAQTAG